jgi:hypothetical protein
MKFIGDILPATLEFFSDRLLIWFLTLLFLVALMDHRQDLLNQHSQPERQIT